MRKIEISKVENGATIVKTFDENTPAKIQTLTYSDGANLNYNSTNQTIVVEDNAKTHRPLIFRYEEIEGIPGGVSDLEGYLDYLNNNLFFLAKSGNSSSGNYIPLTGTEEGSPVTGDIVFSLPEDGSNFGSIGVEDDTIRLKYGEKIVTPNGFRDELGSFTHDGAGQFRVNGAEGTVGLYSNQDYSEIDPTNKQIYAQRSYVDTKVPKVSTAGVERAYIINADGSQSTKATSEFGGGGTPAVEVKRALFYLQQLGTDIPIITWTGYNTTGETFSLFRIGVGIYRIKSDQSSSGACHVTTQSQHSTGGIAGCPIISTPGAGPNGTYIYIRNSITGVLTEWSEFGNFSILLSYEKLD